MSGSLDRGRDWSRIWLAGGGAAVAVLLVVAIAIGLLDRQEALDEGTPERAVQVFIKAAGEQDYKAMHTSLTDGLREECTLERLVAGRIKTDRTMRDSQVSLEKVEMVDGTAVVTTRVTRFTSGGPFGSSEYSHFQTYTLRKESGEWRFSQYPWPYFGCERPGFPPAPVVEREVSTPETVTTSTTQSQP